MNYRPMARRSDLVVQESGDETLIYDLKNNKAVCLNETAAIVWKLCDGKRTVSEMAVEVGNQMKSTVDEDFVLLALDQLKNEGLLAAGFEKNERFAGSSRRDVIKKIGIGAMVALPIVSSIVAPKAIAAQSTCSTLVGVCLPFNTPICPAGCAGRTINYTAYNDAGCTSVITSGSFLCAINVVGTPGLIVTSIT